MPRYPNYIKISFIEVFLKKKVNGSFMMYFHVQIFYYVFCYWLWIKFFRHNLTCFNNHACIKRIFCAWVRWIRRKTNNFESNFCALILINSFFLLPQNHKQNNKIIIIFLVWCEWKAYTKKESDDKRTEIDVQRACLIDGREGKREKLAQSRAIYFIQRGTWAPSKSCWFVK